MRLDPAAAYLDYVRGNWNKAREKLFQAIGCDDILEKCGAPSIIHLHKVHLVENLGRIERRCGNLRNGIHIYRDVLCYLGGVRQGITAVPARWGWGGLPLPAGNIRKKLTAMAGDFASMFAGLMMTEARELFSPLASIDDASWDHRTVDSDVLAWFRVKRAFLYGTEADFIQEVQCFRDAHVQNSRLCCAVAVDLFERTVIREKDINAALGRDLARICRQNKIETSRG